MQRPFDQVCEIIFKTLTVRPSEAEQKELIERILQLLSRLAKQEAAREKIVASKDIMLKLFVYYTFPDTNKSALITLHTLFSQKSDLVEILLDSHNFTLASFDSFVSTSKANFTRTMETNDWNEYVNVCSSIIAFVG